MPIEFPRVIGHEITGEIAEVGPGVTGLKVGDPVTAYFYLTCGHCKWCRRNRETLCENFGGFVGREVDGGYAEYLKLPESSFLKLPEGLDYKNHPAEVGVVTDAIATPVKVIRHAGVQPTDTVAVFGAGGGLGIHMLMLARWAHTKVIAVDTKPEKFAACREAGADVCVDGGANDLHEQLMDATGGAGLDVAIDFVSSTQTLESAAGALGRGGRLVTLGGAGQEFRASAGHLLNNEIVLMGSRYATKQEVAESLELVARGDFWPLVTEVGKMADAEAIHEKVEKGEVTGRAAILIQ
jgi:propanol-preferring alcohol dehydrogenase